MSRMASIRSKATAGSGETNCICRFEGKMVHAFDHRAASVVNPENTLFRTWTAGQNSRQEHTSRLRVAPPTLVTGFRASRTMRDYPIGLIWATLGVSRTSRLRQRPNHDCGHSSTGWVRTHFAGASSHRRRIGIGMATNLVWRISTASVSTTLLGKKFRQPISIGTSSNSCLSSPGEGYDRFFGEKTAGELVRDHVLRLTFTSDDMSAFARDLGYTGLPFVWDAEERRHLRARLDALYFHLYGLSRDDAGYILDTFPIVRGKTSSSSAATAPKNSSSPT